MTVDAFTQIALRACLSRVTTIPEQRGPGDELDDEFVYAEEVDPLHTGSVNHFHDPLIADQTEIDTVDELDREPDALDIYIESVGGHIIEEQLFEEWEDSGRALWQQKCSEYGCRRMRDMVRHVVDDIMTETKCGYDNLDPDPKEVDVNLPHQMGFGINAILKSLDVLNHRKYCSRSGIAHHHKPHKAKGRFSTRHCSF